MAQNFEPSLSEQRRNIQYKAWIAFDFAIRVLCLAREALYERRSQDGGRREKGSSDFSTDGKIVSGSRDKYKARSRGH